MQFHSLCRFAHKRTLGYQFEAAFDKLHICVVWCRRRVKTFCDIYRAAALVSMWPVLIIIIVIVITIITATNAVELSLGGSSPYTGTDKTNKNKYT